MAKYHGKNGVVYMGAATAVPVLMQTEWSLNSAAATDDVTTFENANMQYVQGIPDGVVTLSGVWDDTDDAIWDLSLLDDPSFVYLYPSALVTTTYWDGMFWVSFDDISVPVAGAVRVSCTLSASEDYAQKG
jgi:hypothetical protein